MSLRLASFPGVDKETHWCASRGNNERHTIALQDLEPGAGSIPSIKDRGEQTSPSAHARLQHALLYLALGLRIISFPRPPLHHRNPRDALQGSDERSSPFHAHDPDRSQRGSIPHQSFARTVGSLSFA
jgi:hypothetical protein